MIKNIFYLILISFFVFFLFNISQPEDSEGIKFVNIAEKKIKVDLALSPDEQERGLSGRPNLGEGEGMLFIFDKLAKYSFWMKDMNFAIDIIWIGENMKIIYIEKNAQPDSYPQTYRSNQNTKYVLEVVAGFSEKNNLKVGDRVEFAF